MNPLDIKKLEFLDLDYSFKDRSIISLDNYRFTCRFNKQFKHLLHGECQQLNSITDLMVSLGYNIERCNTNTVRLLEIMINSITETKKTVKQLRDNFDFLKNQNEILIQSLSQLKSVIPSKSLITELEFLLKTNKPKAIEIETKKMIEDLNNRSQMFNDKIKQLEKLVADVKYIMEN